jgi:hypothetical protein
LFNAGLYLLDMVYGVVSFAYNAALRISNSLAGYGAHWEYSHMQMRLSILLRVFNPLLQDLLRLLHKLSMKINSITIHSPNSIVLPKYIVGGLLVVLIHLRRMLFPFLGQLMCEPAIPILVGLVRAIEAGAAFRGFTTREVAEAVVLGF